MFNKIIETDRLILRPFSLEDIEDSYVMELDPEVNRYTGDGGVKTRAQIEQLLQGLISGDYQKYGYGRFAVVLKENQQFIGFAGLKYIPEYQETDIGYRFKKEYWGKGLATEAAEASVDFGFKTLGLEKIVAFVLPENIKSIKLLEKLNFQFDKQFYEEGLLVNKYQLYNGS